MNASVKCGALLNPHILLLERFNQYFNLQVQHMEQLGKITAYNDDPKIQLIDQRL